MEVRNKAMRQACPSALIFCFYDARPDFWQNFGENNLHYELISRNFHLEWIVFLIDSLRNSVEITEYFGPQIFHEYKCWLSKAENRY